MIYANFGAWKSQNNEILGRKGDLEVFLSGSDPDEKSPSGSPVKREGEDKEQAKGRKLPQICDRNEK